MKHKILSLFLLTTFLFSISAISAATVAEWDLTTDGVASNVETNLDAGDFTAGTGISEITFGSTGAYANSWSATILDADDYFQITLSPDTGYDLEVSNINFGIRRSGTGPEDYEVQYSINSDFSDSTTIATETLADDSEADGSITGLNIDVADGETLYLRIFGYDADASTGTLRINDATLNVEGTVTESTTEPPVEEESFCEIGAIGEEDLKINKVKITNHGLGEDSEDEVWFPLDRIEVEVELENNGDVEIEDIVFVLGLFEKGSSSDIADEMFWLSEDDEEIEIGDIEEQGEDDELTHTFEFRINPEDLEEGDYILKIKAYSDDLNEDTVCIDYSDDLSDSDFGNSKFNAEVDIKREAENDERAVVVDVDELSLPIEATCGESVILDVDVWNIGDEDQTQVKVNLFNEALGLDMDYEIREDMDVADDKETAEFSFKIPQGMDEKTYTLEFRTFYDYDDDDDRYDEESEVLKAHLKVDGNCQAVTPQANVQITATLDSSTPEAIAGKQVIVRSTIRNTGDETATYTISLSGHSSWSSLGAIDPQTITLDAGQSQDVEIYLDLDADAEGDKGFTITATSGDKSTEKEIALSITGGAAGITGASIGDHVRDNWFIYAIVFINIILIIAIILVVKSMVAKPAVM